MFDISGKETDQNLPITVNVEDKNDNAPEFIGGRFFTVEERCRAGMKEKDKRCIFKYQVEAIYHTKIKGQK